MKVYILKEEDFENLLLKIDRDARHGHDGGSSQCFTEEESRAQKVAHKFYNYQIRTWISKVKGE